MQLIHALITIGAICVIWNVVTTIVIYGALQKRGVPVSFLWLRMLAPKYTFQYKEITRTESGRTGPLFYHWIISINLALVIAIIALLAAL